MSGFPYNGLAQQFSLFPSYYTIDENGQATIQTSSFIHNGPMPHLPAFLAESLSSDIDYDDPSRSFASSQGSSRSRRRAAGSGEHVKFRRTRSGCYTCRNRRVKCDESRPTCERCKKGNRDCIYPEPAPAIKGRRESQKEKDGGESSQESSNDDLDEEILKSSVSAGSVERDITQSPLQSESNTTLTAGSDYSSTPKDGSISPTLNKDANLLTRSRSMSASTWDNLPEDIKFYMNYARDNLTAHHWNYSPDGPNGLYRALLDAAVKYEPLLYAVTCFAAYHYNLGRADGRIENFLNYHSKSVLSLSKLLKKGEKRNLATLLTILQLATIEECLGDWVNLMSHQKAAHQLLIESYTPETIMRHSTLRNIFMWYLHFDLYVGMLSGTPQIISRDWLVIQHNYYLEQLQVKPDDLDCILGETAAKAKVISYDMLICFGKASNGQLSETEIIEQLAYYADVFEHFEEVIPLIARNPEQLVTDSAGAAPRAGENLFNSHESGLIYGGECFPTNQVIMNWLGLRIIFETRQAAILKRNLNTDLIMQIVVRMGKMINAIYYWPGALKGALLTFRANLSLVAFMLPAGERQKNWAKKMFAAVEAQGYIYPKSIRTRTQAHWGEDESVWWLPDDESVPPVIRQIREFTADRAHGHKQDDKATNLREMKGIFNTLSLSDASSPESAQSPGSSSNLRGGSSDKRSPADELMITQMETPP